MLLISLLAFYLVFLVYLVARNHIPYVNETSFLWFLAGLLVPPILWVEVTARLAMKNFQLPSVLTWGISAIIALLLFIGLSGLMGMVVGKHSILLLVILYWLALPVACLCVKILHKR